VGTPEPFDGIKIEAVARQIMNLEAEVLKCLIIVFRSGRNTASDRWIAAIILV
jgi:hypothetical protein